MTGKLTGNQRLDTCSDALLVTLWLEGNNLAFDTLYIRYVTQLVDFASGKVGNRDLAKEFVQDVFFDVFKRQSNLNVEKSIKSYLYEALRHRVYNYYREVLVRKKHEAGIIGLWPSVHNETEKQLAYQELSQLVNASVQELPEKCRAVYVLSREENLSHKEIAGRLNISVNTVEQHMRKALQRLRYSLQHYLVWIAVGLTTVLMNLQS